MFLTHEISLLDLAEDHYADVWLVFRDFIPTGRKHCLDWLFKRFKPGYQHVEIWTLDRAVWIRLDYCFEYITHQAYLNPPWQMMKKTMNPHYLRVRRRVKLGKMREPFMLGPYTCCEMAKAALGIRAFFVRTPWQLYKHLRKNKNDHAGDWFGSWRRAWLRLRREIV